MVHDVHSLQGQGCGASPIRVFYDYSPFKLLSAFLRSDSSLFCYIYCNEMLRTSSRVKVSAPLQAASLMCACAAISSCDREARPILRLRDACCLSNERKHNKKKKELKPQRDWVLQSHSVSGELEPAWQQCIFAASVLALSSSHGVVGPRPGPLPRSLCQPLHCSLPSWPAAS